METNDPVRPVEEEQTVERVAPVEPVRPAGYHEYRSDVVRTERYSPASRLAQLVYVVFGIVIGLIIIRVILKALDANTGASFTSFLYGITTPLVAPFQGIFNTPQSGNGSIFEFSSIVAIIVYALIAWALVRLIIISGPRRTTVTP